MFTSEKELMSTFKNRTEDFLARVCPQTYGNNIFMIEEFDSYNGIPDLVIGTFASSLRNSEKRTSIDRNWVFPLTELAIGDVLFVKNFSVTYGITENTARKILKSYEVAGFLRKISRIEFQVIKQYEILTKSIISIEGKLKNWRRALQQAQRYRRFSNLSFVLLEKRYSRSAECNIRLFSSANIGLVVMNEHDYTIKHMPLWNNIKISEYVLRLHEAAFSAYTSTFTFS